MCLSVLTFHTPDTHFTFMGGFSFSSMCFIIASRTSNSKAVTQWESPIFTISAACTDHVGQTAPHSAVGLLVNRGIIGEMTVFPELGKTWKES